MLYILVIIYVRRWRIPVGDTLIAGC